MARWQRRARLGFGLFAVVFAVVLWFAIGERRTASTPSPVTALEPEAVSEIKGGDVVQVKGSRRDIRVEFASQVLYADGSARYTGFKAFVDDRGGRSFEITGSEARVAPEQTAFDVRGDVTLRTSDGLTARTPQATFADADGILSGDGPVTFARERVTGSGVGFRYDRSLDRLELLDRAVINVAPGSAGGGMAVTAGSAAHSRLERFMRFERGTRMERDGQVIEADASTVFLLPDRDEPETVELRGNARITGAAGSESLQAMQAQDINLRYAADGRTLEHALLVGQGAIQLAGAGGAPGQRLAAEILDLRLAPDGAVTALEGERDVRVTLPAAADAPARTVQAASVSGQGAAGRGLTRMTFETDVVYREEAGRGGQPRSVRARTLNASLTEAGTIDEALFSGGFAFEEGPLRARSAEAVYRVPQGTLALRAPGGGAQPNLSDERIDLRGEIIDVTLSPRRLTAAGRVSATLAPGGTARGTSLMSEQEPVLISCDKLTFDEQTGAGTYSGNAKVWQQQGGNSIKADTITMNDESGVVTATGNVVTSLPLAARAEQGAKGHSIARAGEFQFDDARRRAVFVTQAQLDGAQGHLRAHRIELALAPTGNDLRQLTAEGAVRLSLENREATGQHLVFHPDDERYVLNGTPVMLREGCQESSGRTLTFYRGSAKILVDGNEETRVQMKGGKCPEPPR